MKTLYIAPSHIDKWLLRNFFNRVKIYYKRWHLLMRYTPSRVEKFSLFLYLCGSCETLSHNLKFEPLFSHSFSLTLHKFPSLSNFLSSTHESTTFHSPSLFYFLSTTHTHQFSIYLSHYFPSSLFPSFLFILFSLFSQIKDLSRKRFRVFPQQDHINNLHKGTLICLILWDRSSLHKNLLLLEFV